MRRSSLNKTKQSLRLKVSEVKARFSHCLRVAKDGGEVVVMDRETPVARIIAIENKTNNAIEITPAVGNMADLANIEPLNLGPRKPGSKSALDLLFEDRRSGY